MIEVIVCDVARPNTCTHRFCAPCLDQWAQQNNTCPLCRSTFQELLISESLDGPVSRVVTLNDATRFELGDDDGAPTSGSEWELGADTFSAMMRFMSGDSVFDAEIQRILNSPDSDSEEDDRAN